MTQRNDRPRGGTGLRRRAEAIAERRGVPSPKRLQMPSREEALRLVHELRVHQIELRMQNDELRRAQAELHATRERYFDLYNLAPVGYFIVSGEGRILETNLTGANLLGVPRAALIKQPITRFIFTPDQDVYYLHRRELLATGKAHTCELRMVKTDGTASWVRLTATTQASEARAGQGKAGGPATRLVLSDISEQKQMKQAKQTPTAQPDPANERRHPGPRAARAKGGKAAARK
jgi:PAS domain S-box-containing protein